MGGEGEEPIRGDICFKLSLKYSAYVCVCACVCVLYRQGNAYFGIQKTITKSQQFTYYGLPELNTCSRTYSTDTIVNPSPTHTPSHSPLHSSSTLRGSGTNVSRQCLGWGQQEIKEKKNDLKTTFTIIESHQIKGRCVCQTKKKGSPTYPKRSSLRAFLPLHNNGKKSRTIMTDCTTY